MKKIIIIIIAFLSVVSLNAQRKVEKSLKVTGNEEVYLNFKFARNIIIEQWEKDEVQVKAEVTINDGEGNEHFSLQTEKKDGTLKIYSDFGDYIKMKNRSSNYNCSMTIEVLYEVYVPRNGDLKIKSISGDVVADTFYGNLKTDLVSGNVTIKNYTGELWLETVSGDLDVTIERAKVRAETVTGTIYSDLEFDRGNSKKHRSGENSIAVTINNGEQMLKMETVSGDIFMRKK